MVTGMGPVEGEKMSDEHKQLIGIPAEHTLVQTSSKTEQRKGKDTDIDYYDELDANGQLVAKYEVKETMSIYPPFGVSKSFTKL